MILHFSIPEKSGPFNEGEFLFVLLLSLQLFFKVFNFGVFWGKEDIFRHIKDIISGVYDIFKMSYLVYVTS